MNYSNKMAIVVVTCDENTDVILEYLRYFDMNWSDCPYELIVATESASINNSKARVIQAGENARWTKRAILGINSTSCPYILLTMDDGFIAEKVDTNEVEEILSFIKEHKIKYYRNPKRVYNFKKNPVFSDRNDAYRIRKNQIYGVNFGHNIWDRDIILELLGDGSKSAWQIEEYFNELALDSEAGYYDDYVSDKNNFLHIVETVSHGKWMPKEIKKLEKLGIPVNKGSRGVLPMSDSIKRFCVDIAYHIVPSKYRKGIKKRLSKIGVKFVINN